jgi:hypothetical protein
LLEDRLREPRQDLVIVDDVPNLHLQGEPGEPLIGESLQICVGAAFQSLRKLHRKLTELTLLFAGKCECDLRVGGLPSAVGVGDGRQYSDYAASSFAGITSIECRQRHFDNFGNILQRRTVAQEPFSSPELIV